MADFNQYDLNPTSDPNYERSVKEVNPNLVVAGLSNASRENNLNLFKGVANAVGDVVEGGYRAVTDSIKNQVYEGTDPIRDAQGVGSAVLGTEAGAAKAAGLGKPSDPEAVQQSISKLHAAWEQGKIGDTPYYAQLEAMTRSIRSRFPGFREEVDAMVHHVTGITPANALRASIQNDLQNAQSAQDALTKDMNHFEVNKGAFLPADYYQRKASGKPYSFEETKAYVADQERAEHNITAANSALEFKAKNLKLNADEAEITARNNAATLDQRIWSQTAPLFKEINDRLKSGVPLGEDERAQYTARYQEVLVNAQRAYGDLFDSPLSKGSSMTLGGLVQGKRESIIKEHMEQFELLKNSLFDPKSGLVDMAEQRSKTIMDNATLQIQKQYPVFAATAALTKLWGPAAGQIMQQVMVNPQIRQKVSGPILEILNGQNLALITGGASTPSGKTTLNKQLDDYLNTAEGKNPSNLKSWIDAKVDVLSNPALEKDQLANAASVVFGDPENLKFMQRFNEKSQLDVLTRLASPSVTANMQKLGGEHWKNYSEWVKNAFAVTYSTLGTQIADIPNRPYIKVSQDPKTGHFIVEPTPEGIRQVNQAKSGRSSMAMNTLQWLEKINSDNVKQAVDKINRGIDMVAPILKADGHSDIGQQVQNLTKFIAISDKKNPGTWQNILKWFGNPDGKEDPKNLTFGGTPVNFTQASGDNPGGLSLEDPSGAAGALKAAFSKGESGDNYNRLVDTPTHPKETNLTSMSIKDVLAYQQGMLDAGNKSSAAGKYQIVSKTLRSLVNEGVVSMTDKYDEATQEKLADALLERRGLSDYLNGKVKLGTFMQRLGNEWEIIKKSPAAYHKVMFELEQLRVASN